MEENTTVLRPEDIDIYPEETKSGNGLKVAGVVALTGLVGLGLAIGVKRIVKAVKAKKEKASQDEVEVVDD